VLVERAKRIFSKPASGAASGASAGWAPRCRTSNYSERAQTSATMAPPRHMPVPMRCTKSTGRMVARLGRPSMLQRLRRPKAARTKATRKDSRRELMDYDLLGVVAEEWKRHHDARPRLLRTRTTPTTRQMIAGQDVKKNKSPGPIGFGFGSGQSPIAASRMIARSGPQPKTTKARPTITHLFRRYSLILWVSLVPTPELSRAAKRLRLE